MIILVDIEYIDYPWIFDCWVSSFLKQPFLWVAVCDDSRDAVCALNYAIVKIKLDDNAVYTA